MYAAKRRRKAKTGSVKVRSSNDRLQLVFSFGGKRYFISTGLSNPPYHRKQAQEKALEVERDILMGSWLLQVKRLQRQPKGVIRVTSDNSAYDPFSVRLQDEGTDFVIVGRVVWVGRKLGF